MSQYDIEITPLNTKLDTSKLHKLDLANDAKSIMSPFVRELPALYSSGVMQNAYILKFPAGLPHQLMQLKQGGVSSTIVNESHKIVIPLTLHLEISFATSHILLTLPMVKHSISYDNALSPVIYPKKYATICVISTK